MEGGGGVSRRNTLFNPPPMEEGWVRGRGHARPENIGQRVGPRLELGDGIRRGTGRSLWSVTGAQDGGGTSAVQDGGTEEGWQAEELGFC